MAMDNVVARTFDLTRSIVDVISNEKTLRSTTQDVIDWLSRERIDKLEYKNCLDRMRALALPNENGLEIRQQVQESEERLQPIAGLKMVLSGSIGRSMLWDPDYTYIVTTAATAMSYHGLHFAAEILCNMAMDKGGHEKGVRYGYSIHRTRLMPVLAKVVDSVALNVVNAGCDLKATLPESLRTLCAHPMTAVTFSAVAMAIMRAKEDLVLTSDSFPPDMAAWLLTHFQGHLEISVGGKIVLDGKLGPENRNLVFLVYEKCQCGDGRRKIANQSRHVSLAVKREGSFVSLIEDNYCFDPNPCPTDRQKLYGTDMLWDWQRAKLRPQEISEVRITAIAIIRWLLSVPVKADPKDVGFKCKPDGREDGQGHSPKILSIESLLGRYPAILHKNWGGLGSQDRAAVYIPPVARTKLWEEHGDDIEDDYGSYEDVEGWTTTPRVQRTMAQVMDCFPIAQGLFEMVRERCGCGPCQRNEPVGIGKFGCLREVALDELLLLVKHAISDGFGAPDASGMFDREAQRSAVCDVFSDIIDEGVVLWDTWFRLVALVYLGGSWNKASAPRERGSTAFAAVQRGSLVVAPAWLDLTSDLTKKHFLSAEFRQGQLMGVTGDFAVVETEEVMSLGEKFTSEASSISEVRPDAVLDVDLCEAVLQTAIIGAAGKPYRLLIMIRSNLYRRIIDPADTIMGIH